MTPLSTPCLKQLICGGRKEPVSTAHAEKESQQFERNPKEICFVICTWGNYRTQKIKLLWHATAFLTFESARGHAKISLKMTSCIGRKLEANRQKKS